jgi:hypothetical protein
MKFRVVWNYPAIATFYALDPREAEALDRAVIRFAETGEGRLTKVSPYYRLGAGMHDALLTIDSAGESICVLRIYRVR